MWPRLFRTKKFQADFTSSSPYVVSVGATTFPGTPGHITPTPGTEVGIGFSSGGFSNQFTQVRDQGGGLIGLVGLGW